MPPDAVIREWISRRPSGLRAMRITCAPVAAKAMAAAAPMPLEAPVTNATRVLACAHDIGLWHPAEGERVLIGLAGVFGALQSAQDVEIKAFLLHDEQQRQSVHSRHHGYRKK